LFVLAPIQDLRPLPIFQHVLWIHPFRRFERGAADQQVGGSRQHFVRAVGADDFARNPT